MPTKILSKERLIPGRTSKLVLEAPQIAAAARPGHFVILRVDAHGERFPLTIADTDVEKGTITIVYLVMGRSTQMLEELEAGQEILDVCGPLGRATNIVRFDAPKKVICVGGGTGVAAMHHIAKGHHAAGNYVISCIGARNKDLLLFHKELSLFSDEVLVSTDDGSMGLKGIVTDLVRGRLDAEGADIAEVVAVGPVPMMQAVADLTRGYGTPTTVSLNSLMVDGLGMCGACRVTVGGKMKFTCVDGPEFDGHEVDFAELRMRLGSFRAQEQVAKEQHRCHCFEKKEA
ncbi:MAG: sulfide/dihydroorotate dehydrogenase-like FAD/NAD-binding protein [Mailhella sp.]|jgi:ferredoxin--NADP+ reductase|nr:sulfide/dihydroorotate dehydrogenase-like FAD/NAD-binding protein [Mailhella sp.]